MSQTVSPEQLERLKSLQSRWDDLTKYNGELRYQLRLLEKEIAATDSALDALDTERLAISNELTAQFGTTGNVNLETGEFAPD